MPLPPPPAPPPGTTPATGESPGSELVDELVQVSFAVSTVLNRVGARHDLSPTQIRLLGILRDRTPTVTALAELLGLEKSTISGLVDRAEKRGLVERRPSAADGRAVEVVLTRAGRALARVGEVDLADRLAPLLEPLGERERGQLRDLLRRIAAG